MIIVLVSFAVFLENSFNFLFIFNMYVTLKFSGDLYSWFYGSGSHIVTGLFRVHYIADCLTHKN